MNDTPESMVQISVMATRDPDTGKYIAIPLYAQWEDLIGFSEAARDYLARGFTEQQEKRDTNERN